jgi:hypothetical protein
LSREQKALVELYELFCPNADPYGLRRRLFQWHRKGVNARLEKLKISSTNVPDRIQRIWMGLENEAPSLLELAFGDLSPLVLER